MPVARTVNLAFAPPVMVSNGVPHDCMITKSLVDPQEVASLQGRLGGTVNVEVDSMPGADLQKILAEIRDQYENVMEKNRQEAQALHKSQVRKGKPNMVCFWGSEKFAN